jgi:hypothetical protein
MTLSIYFSAWMRPFKVTFKTDANEVTANGGNAILNEESFAPGGIVGFQLTYTQIAC